MRPTPAVKVPQPAPSGSVPRASPLRRSHQADGVCERHHQRVPSAVNHDSGGTRWLRYRHRQESVAGALRGQNRCCTTAGTCVNARSLPAHSALVGATTRPAEANYFGASGSRAACFTTQASFTVKPTLAEAACLTLLR